VSPKAAAALPASDGQATGWVWPVDLCGYDRAPALTSRERQALRSLGESVWRRRYYDANPALWQAVDRLVRPLDQARAALHYGDNRRNERLGRDAVGVVLNRCARTGTAFWGWSADDWCHLLGASLTDYEQPWPLWVADGSRSFALGLGYLLGGFVDLHRIGSVSYLALAQRVFGPEAVDTAFARITDVLRQWGYQSPDDYRLSRVVSTLLLVNRSPYLEDLTAELLERRRALPHIGAHEVSCLFTVHKALAALGICTAPPNPCGKNAPSLDGTAPEWEAWVQRWYETSTLSPKVRTNMLSALSMIGKWLAGAHPQITEPAQWTRQICADWVAAVDRMRVGEYNRRSVHHVNRAGAPIGPATKIGYLTATRTFFRDCQEWEWIPRRFDPSRALAAPRSVTALVGPNPRVIADDVWAKLLWAGINIQLDDFPANTGQRRHYPLELLRAITLTWLFGGLRSDEIARLRLGCIRWQHNGQPIGADSRDVLAADAVCLLDVPTNKTGTAFTKPVDPILGQAIETWQAVRPTQPTTIDRKTAESVDLLFCFRARAVSKTYINAAIIPTLCAKAAVPTADVRGNITSHRARSTIASQLYNAKEPMTLFELQAWLGHRSPNTTQHYAKITPNTLTKAYRDAGYFARNVRTIEVLVDRDAVATGAAASGQPWQHYDLGHGYCAYTFFEQCPHRMACARCDFYTPKGSSKAQLLEAKENLQRMLASIPLTDDERAAVDDGKVALDHLLERLIDTPTPAGTTPRQIGIPATATLLPIVHVKQGNTDKI
jgi:integrase